MAQDETNIQLKSREKLERRIKEVLDRSSGEILDLIDVALGDEGKFKAIRPKILRVINNSRRIFQKELERYYTVEYNAVTEDIIVFGNKKNNMKVEE